MADRQDKDGFQFVKSKRNRKNKRPNHPHTTHKDDNDKSEHDAIDQDSMRKRIYQCRLDITGSDFMSDVKDILEHIRKHVRGLNESKMDAAGSHLSTKEHEDSPGDAGDSKSHDRVAEMVCYGIGNFTSCPIARYQLALLLILRDESLIHDSDCHIYDPVFTKPEEEILRKLDFNVLQSNEEGKRRVRSPTVVYMPHCGRPLYNNLLWTNWRPDLLPQLMIIGNSFKEMADRTPDRILRSQTSYIYNVLQYSTEQPLENSFQFTDIFNDTVLHLFSADRAESAGHAEWCDPDEPVYEQDVEIITKSS